MKIRLGPIEIDLKRYLALWTLVVLVFAFQGCTHDALLSNNVWAASDYLRWSAIQWYAWAALAPLVFHLGERYPLPRPLRVRALWRHLLLALAVTLLAVVAGALVSAGGFAEQLQQFLGQHVAAGMATYFALLALQQALHYREQTLRQEREAARLASELAQSRLQVLKTQLQPHFLFNTLHAIVTLLDEDKRSAEDMLLKLSELLRAFLEEYDGQEITVQRELALLDLYLGIQRRRYGDRLETRLYVDPEALDCAVPSLILQPLVENAIQHGIGQHAGGDCGSGSEARAGPIAHRGAQPQQRVGSRAGAATAPRWPWHRPGQYPIAPARTLRRGGRAAPGCDLAARRCLPAALACA